MTSNRLTSEVAHENKSAKKRHVWRGLVAGLVVVAAAVGVQHVFLVPKPVAPGEKAGPMSAVTPEGPQVQNQVAERLQGCKFLVNQRFKRNAKVYLCLFSASWCPPCRAEMPRIAKLYAETLLPDPDIELIHFSRDQDDDRALAWAKEHDVKFPVVRPNGGNPLGLHSRGIPHLFVVRADGTLMEEGHPMRLFTEEKLRALTGKSP